MNLVSEIIAGLKHTFYIYSHPFDGFYIMKTEKKGNVKSATAILILLLITTVYRILGSGFLFAFATLSSVSVWMLILAILVVVALYCIINWSITTLLDGKGNFSEIFTALMYALTPIVLLNIPITVLTHVIVKDEAAFYSLLNIVVLIWTAFLILAANLSIHEYTMLKSVFTVLLTLVGMIAVAVLVVLFCNLVQQVWTWCGALVNELLFRM